MRLTQYFLPALKENPAEAQIVSHRLMLRAGADSPDERWYLCLAAAWLSSAEKIEQLVREEQDAAGA